MANENENGARGSEYLDEVVEDWGEYIPSIKTLCVFEIRKNYSRLTPCGCINNPVRPFFEEESVDIGAGIDSMSIDEIKYALIYKLGFTRGKNRGYLEAISSL
ncbi:MAG: hypothetical protein Q8N88_05345 [Nanoarchaeota archaeon]|nr:hypothetical protein [Nanoarchaeota archaeon]